MWRCGRLVARPPGVPTALFAQHVDREEHLLVDCFIALARASYCIFCALFVRQRASTMLISTTKRETVLSDSGRLPGTDVGRHLGPGKYSVDSQSIGARKQRASFGGFGTAARNLVPVKEGPGPGRFQQNQFNFKKKKKKQKPSSVFKSKKDRFDAGIAGSAAHLGPGHYALPSDFDKRPQSKNNASAPPLIVGHEPSVPSVPRINQSFGYEEGADGKLKLHQPAKVIYGGAKYGNHNDVNDRTSWISKQILDTVGPAYYDRPNDTSFAAAMAKRSKPGKTVRCMLSLALMFSFPDLRFTV